MAKALNLNAARIGGSIYEPSRSSGSLRKLKRVFTIIRCSVMFLSFLNQPPMERAGFPLDAKIRGK